MLLNDMVTLEVLRAKTAAFLDLHWPQNEPRPEWSAPWTFVGTIPNQELQGVYALAYGDDIVYVGLGAGKNSGPYEGAGLGQRLHRYWRKHPTDLKAPDGQSRYVPSDVWGGVTRPASIVTLGLSADRANLASPLEAFLIGELKPERNVAGVGPR